MSGGSRGHDRVSSKPATIPVSADAPRRLRVSGPPRAAYSVLQEADVSLLILGYLRRPTQMALIDTNTVLSLRGSRPVHHARGCYR